jgi:hypothetical protein
MALDIKKLAEQFADLDYTNKKSSFSDKDHLFKPKEGEYVIRILPLKENSSSFFLHGQWYYKNTNPIAKIADKNLLSPKVYDRDDPIFALAQELGKNGKTKAARTLYPRDRYYSPILLREVNGEQVAPEVKYYSYGIRVLTQFMNYLQDSDYGDFSDFKDGYDINLVIKKNSEGFLETMVTPKRKNSTVYKDWDEDEVMKVIDEMPTKEDIFSYVPEYDDLVKWLEEYAGGQDTDADVEGSDNTDDTTGDMSDDDVTAQFDKLLKG